ncbi:MAG: ABC transporter ATP-binding protein [Planctomycetales bacterium]|nr:ABC transporter ATP-binding protein [Planctomycetales bacterium]
MLLARDLAKRYGDRVALDGVSIEARPGEVVGVLGPNGAGKTTLVSILCGLRRPDRGEARIGGEDPAAAPSARARLGVCPQEVAVYPELTAEQNLRFFGGLFGMRGARLAERSRAVLERVGLADRSREPVQKFSGGMRRRLNLAVAMLHEPAALLLDEPTVGVDPQSRSHLFEEVARLRGEGRAVLYTTHYMEEAERLCDRIVVMDLGKIVAQGTLAEILALGGTARRVTVAFADGGAAPDRAALARAAAPAEVLECGPVSVVLSAADPGALLPALLGHLHAAGHAVAGVEVERRTLESVFLKLTGRRLRDE